MYKGRGEKKDKIQSTLKILVKTQAICLIVKSQGTFSFKESNWDEKTKPTAISEVRDGHLPPLLIFTLSDGWNAI